MAPQALQANIELTAQEYAQLKGCGVRYVQQHIKEGKLPAVQRLNERNRPIYYIPLAALDAKLQRRYLKGGSGGGVALAMPGRQTKSFELYSLTEQQQINFWAAVLEEWRQYRLARNGLPKAEADEQFVVYATVAKQQEFQSLFGREMNLTRPTLYRYWRSYRDNNLDGLLDGRGKASKGKSTIDPAVWDVFLDYYLDQRQYPVVRCYEYTQLYVKQRKPELYEDIPSVSSFYRRLERDVPEPLRVLGREGHKAWNDRCAPYVKRYIDTMDSDEWWVADNHTMDVLTDMGDGKVHRLYLSAIFDPRSYTFVGCMITDKINSQLTVATLRKCIQKRQNRPLHFYVDNGREYTAFDVAGPGHRARKKRQDEFTPPPILERLGIHVVNALPRNGQAKLVERAFLDVKNQLSRLFPTFTGGNVTEKPEMLKYNLKKGKAVADKELTDTIEYLLDWYFNQQPYGGMVVKDRGKPRMQVYEENLHKQRVTSEDSLNLMMMRSSRKQTIGPRGVNLKIGGEQFDFFNDDTATLLFGQEVYFRYDPENLSSVRIYDLENRLLTVAPMDSEMRAEYGDNKEKIEEAMRKKRNFQKNVMQMLENSGLPEGEHVEALELVMTLAQENEAEAALKPVRKVKHIKLESFVERPLYEQAVGCDLDLMIETSIQRNKGGKEDG